MASDLDLRGVWVPLVTPFASDGSVDVATTERLAGEYLDAGAAGIVALGTTGESPALDSSERRAVVGACSRACQERGAPLIVGTGTNSTRTTIEQTQALDDVPALAGVLVVTPYYVRPSVAGIVAHFEAVAAASPVPVVLYNIPYRTGRAVPADAMVHLSAVPNIAGVKQAVGSLDADTLRVLAGKHRDFHVVGGEDPILFPIVCMGGAGAICASSHVCTERFVAMIDCGLAGKLDDGRAHAEALLPVVEACFAEPNPTVFKGVLHAQGRIPTPAVRLPLVPASEAAVERAHAAVAAAT
jgi:4-hydroxy-tetrahydrodipicolinate synthase